MTNQTLTGLFCIDVNLRKFPVRSLGDFRHGASGNFGTEPRGFSAWSPEDFRHGASGIFGTEPRGFSAWSPGLIFRRFMIIMMAEGYAI